MLSFTSLSDLMRATSGISRYVRRELRTLSSIDDSQLDEVTASYFKGKISALCDIESFLYKDFDDLGLNDLS